MALTSSYIVSLLHLDQIFPSVSSVVIFFTYMVVCLQQALLVTASRTENEKTYPYNPATVVMLTEVVKLVLAFAFYIKRLLFLYQNISYQIQDDKFEVFLFNIRP